MSINSPMISAGSTVQRKDVTSQPIDTGNVAAGQVQQFVVNGSLASRTIEAEYQGQLYAQIVGQGSSAYATLWIAADVGGTLSWFNIPLGHSVNPDTGKPHLKSIF